MCHSRLAHRLFGGVFLADSAFSFNLDLQSDV